MQCWKNLGTKVLWLIKGTGNMKLDKTDKETRLLGSDEARNQKDTVVERSAGENLADPSTPSDCKGLSGRKDFPAHRASNTSSCRGSTSVLPVFFKKIQATLGLLGVLMSEELLLLTANTELRLYIQ